MTVILPNGSNPNDPMVQQAMQKEIEQAKLMQVVNAIKTQLLVSLYAALVVEHASTGEPLSFEEGRKIAAHARALQVEYDPFVFEALGMAQLEKKEEA